VAAGLDLARLALVQEDLSLWALVAEQAVSVLQISGTS